MMDRATIGSVLLELLQTVSAVEESPTQKVEATTKLTAELLRTLYIGNLLEEFVLGREVSELQIGQPGTTTHLIDPVDSLLGRSIDLILALSGTQQHVGVAHQAQVDTIVKTGDHLVIETCTHVGELADRQTTIGIVGDNSIGRSHLRLVANVAERLVVVVPVCLVSTNGPIKTRVKFATLGTLLLEELIEPW